MAKNQEQTRVEKQIRNVLDTETQAIVLSSKLFSSGGLFSRLATTEKSRRAVAQSAIFRQAQRRLSELQQLESSAFTRSLTESPAEVT